MALRSSSHGFENWPDFDLEVLGGKYGGRGKGSFGPPDRLVRKPHPIWTGAEDFETREAIYNITQTAPDIDVIMEGENAQGKMPVAWTRTYQGGRVFYFVPGHHTDFQKPAYLRIVANALRWVTEKPGASRKPDSSRRSDAER